MKHFFLLLIILYTPFIYSQSIINVGSSASIDIEADANISADSRSGTFTGSGTWNGGALPVELTSFAAGVENNKVTLFWQTATEVNNYGFEILRRYTPQNDSYSEPDLSGEESKIGFVQGNGNSNSPKRYLFLDYNPPSGNVQYRLKQIDFDGKYKYSGIAEVTLEAPTNFALEQNYPNPFNPVTKISYSIPKNGFVSLKIYDVLGKEINTLVNDEMKAGIHEIEFNGGNLASGAYYYQLRSNNFSETKKLILMK